MIGDKIAVKRFERLFKIIEKSNIDSKGLALLSDKFKVNFVQHASLEDDKDIQIMWSNLLKYSIKDNNNDYSYLINIIKELRPLDAKVFDKYILNHNESDDLSSIFLIDKKKPKDIEISLDNLIRLNLLSRGYPIDITGKIKSNRKWKSTQLHLTQLGNQFYDVVTFRSIVNN